MLTVQLLKDTVEIDLEVVRRKDVVWRKHRASDHLQDVPAIFAATAMLILVSNSASTLSPYLSFTLPQCASRALQLAYVSDEHKDN